MARRINVVLEDAVWQSLQAVPKGERSKILNQALAEWMLAQKRRQAALNIESLRGKMKATAGSAERWVREDRSRHR